VRKYEDVDIVSALGAVMEVNTEFYKSDFRYDIDMFRKAAIAPDGENNHLLWLSRRSGTECFIERDVYLCETFSHNAWCFYADLHDSIVAYAVEITDLKDGKVHGNLYELDYREHVKNVSLNSVQIANVTVTLNNGEVCDYPYEEYKTRRATEFDARNKIFSITTFKPENEKALQDIIGAEREKRMHYRPAVFKVKVNARRPSVLSQIHSAAGQQQQVTPVQIPTNQKDNGLSR
jgi:hypothetical protein